MAKRMTARCLLIALTLVAFPAYAQAEAGDGIKSGAFTLTPELSLRGSFDSNVFYQSADEAALSGGLSIAVRPAFRITTEAANNLQLYVDSSVTYQQYLDDGAVGEQSGLSADLGVGAGFNTQGAFSFRIEDRLIRTNEPPPDAASFSYNRLTNKLGLIAGLHPGGKALQHYLSYDWFIYRHDPLDDLNRMTHNFGLKNYWLFLPKTSVVLSADYQIVSYEAQLRDGGGAIANPTFRNANSSPLRITGGLTGLITDRIGARIVGGWGWSFHESTGTPEDATFSGLLVDVQGQWFFGNLSNRNRLYLGYSRDFGEASISRFYTRDKPYAGYSQGLFNQRLRLDATVDVMFRSYAGIPAGAVAGSSGSVNIGQDINDTLVSANLGATYNLTKWWSLGARYTFQANLTDDVVTTASGPDVLREYQRNLFMVETTVRY